MVARHVKRRALAHERHDALAHAVDKALFQQDLRDVRPPDHRLTGEALPDDVHVDGVARLLQQLHHLFVAVRALIDRAVHQLAQGPAVLIGIIGQQMDVLTHVQA